MERNIRPLPIGIDNFKKVIEDGYCYVDKTDLIEDVLTRGALVNLFPRPRRSWPRVRCRGQVFLLHHCLTIYPNHR